MARVRTALVLSLLLSRLAVGGDLYPDLSGVEGVDRFDGSEAARRLLARNGFVVVPGTYHQMFSPYVERKLPPFVTTDSLHAVFHANFEEQVLAMEKAFRPEVELLTHGLRDGLWQEVSAGRVAPEDRGSLELALSYLEVGDALLGHDEPVGRASSSSALEEIRLIHAASGVAPSPLFGYAVDYTDFKPRGFYSGSAELRRHFRAMSWYGNLAFRLLDERETRAALLLSRILHGHPDWRRRWERLDRAYALLVGPTDDLTPAEYAHVWEGLSSPDLESFLRAAEDLRAPRYNSMVLGPEELPTARARTKGLRLFGKRYLPDGEALSSVAYPAVTRRLPSGLDVMAANGSTRAVELLTRAGVTSLPGYAAGAARGREAMRTATNAAAPTHYAELLKLAATLTGPVREDAPPFMKTEAWQDKSLSSALAIWASTRHTWQLAGKSSTTYLGGLLSDRAPGWVESNPEFFRQLLRVIDATAKALAEIDGVDPERLNRVARLVRSIAEIERKQRAGAPLTAPEELLLEDYGERLAGLSSFVSNSYLDDDALPRMSLVADVFTDLGSSSVLQVGSGPAESIDVIVMSAGRPRLFRGAVYSYRELESSLPQRLDDRTWHELMDRGALPPGPAWTASFVGPHDVNELISRLREGERVPELAYANDPAVEPALLAAIQPDGPIRDPHVLVWAMEAWADRAGSRAAPELVRMLGLPRSSSETEELDRERRDAALRHLGHVDSTAYESELLRLLEVEDDPELLRTVIWRLGFRGSRQDLPGLVAAARRLAGGELEHKVLESIGEIWTREGDGLADLSLGRPCGPKDMLLELPPEPPPPPEGWVRPPRFPERATAEAVDAARREVAAHLTDAFDRADERIRYGAFHLASTMQLVELAGPIEASCRARYSPSAFNALLSFGSTEALHAALRLTYIAAGEPTSDALYFAVHSLAWIRSPLAASRLAELLDDRGKDEHLPERVCDAAVEGLAELYPEGPGLPSLGYEDRVGDILVRDLAVARWKDYLTGR